MTLASRLVVLLSVLGSLVMAAPGMAQRDREAPEDSRSAKDPVGEEPDNIRLKMPGRAPVEAVVQAGVVDPKTYVLGPGDVLELALWGRLSRSVLLPVAPEGTIVLPSAGTFEVAGRTLAWAQERVMRGVAETYRGVRADLRLVQLRTFKVYVTGFVKTPGTVTVSPVTRASEAVATVGVEEGGSRRNIEVRRLDGKVQRLDLDRFHLLGDQAFDPNLVDGDVIVVPRAKENIQATGAVGRAGVFELAPNDSLSTLLRLASGPTPSAVRDRALLLRFRTSTEKESLWVDLDRLAESDVQLRGGDHLFVHGYSDYHVLFGASIVGEVVRSGTFPIQVGRDRLSDLVRWSGGFRPLANRSAIYLLRDPVGILEADPEFDRLARLTRSEMTESEYAKFQTKLSQRTNSFRIDWTRVQQEGADVDPLLQDRDIVRVDQLITTVRVEGEVRRPGYVDYVPGRSLKEYVELAGGLTDLASSRSIRVSRTVTGQVIPARNLKGVQPGDFIWVPERRDVDAWALFRDIVMVASQVALIIYTLSN